MRRNGLRFPVPSPRKIYIVLLAVLIILVFDIKAARTFGYQNLESRDPPFIGDEPKYLRMAYSLTKDGDLDLSDLIVTPEEKKEIQAEARRLGSHRFTDLYVVSRNGGIYCLHMPGFSAFIWPAFSLDSRHYPPDPMKPSPELPFLPQELPATKLWLLATAVLTILLLIRLLDNVFRSLVLVGVCLLFFILKSPFPDYAFLLYPEATATFFSLLAFNAILFPFRRKWVNDVFLVIGISALPWLHQRYILLAFGLFLAFLFSLRWTKAALKRLAVLCLSFVVLSIPYFYYFYSITGNPSPFSIQKAYGQAYAQLNILPLGFFGQMFSGNWGLLWVYPWIILFFFGIYWAMKTTRKLALTHLIVYVPYYLICSAAVPWNGAAYPVGRFLVATLPFYLVFSGIALQNLLRNLSLFRVILYGAWFLVIILNKATGFVSLDFGFSFLTPQEFLRMAICVVFLLLFYLSLFLSDKFVFQKRNV
jgi:hypothetical protein